NEAEAWERPDWERMRAASMIACRESARPNMAACWNAGMGFGTLRHPRAPNGAADLSLYAPAADRGCSLEARTPEEARQKAIMCEVSARFGDVQLAFERLAMACEGGRLSACSAEYRTEVLHRAVFDACARGVDTLSVPPFLFETSQNPTTMEDYALAEKQYARFVRRVDLPSLPHRDAAPAVPVVDLDAGAPEIELAEAEVG